MTAAIAAAAFSFGAVSCATEAKPQKQPTLGEACVYVDDGEHIKISIEEVRRCLGVLAIKGKAPKTGYDREQQFGRWRQKDGCDTRETTLIRDLTDEVVDCKTCGIISGTFDDMYTAENENRHVIGKAISAIEIDHVVALSDAWQSGASIEGYPEEMRKDLANDPLNLQATSEKNNGKKNNNDASGWLPPSEVRWCDYVTRQVLIKQRYQLWVKPAEHARIKRILNEDCPKDQAIVVPS
jgi:hypothetical protein